MTQEQLLVTAIGSMPGSNMAETMLQVTDAIPELIAMPELPQRGPGGEMIGRTFGILNDLDTSFSIETTVTGWRQSRGENKVMRRAKSWYQEDLDWLEKSVGSDSLNLKLQFAGPLTLASFIEPPAGERLLSDAGAVRDLAAGLGEAIALQLAAVQKRLPQAKISIQLDEPALELAIQGGLKRRSGRGNLEPVPSEQAIEWINAVVQRIHLPQEQLWIHSCATNFQPVVFEKIKVGIWALPLSAINETRHYQVVSDFWDRGGMLTLGIDPQTLGNQVNFQSIIATVNKFAKQIGLSVEEMPARIGLSPECGLAYISEPLNVLKKLQELSRAIPAEY
jgi:methionine synthase II (cobalamin-independent)